MGLKDWTKKLFPNEYDVDEYTDEDYTEPEEAPVRDDVRPRDNKPTPGGYPAPASNGVQLASRASSSSIEMKVVTPTKFDAVTQIANLLLANKTVLLNLENTNKETAKRLIDFLSGVAYALGGDVQKVADNTFAVTPRNVEVESMDTAAAPAEPEEKMYE